MQTTGDGIKRTPSYETPLTKHKLEKWRQEFWGKYIGFELYFWSQWHCF